MKLIKKSNEAVFAVKIGMLCSFAYMMVYFVRNILSVITPDMIEAGYETEYIGLISTVFMAAYAIGQLINGIAGDYVKSKYMICIGLFTAAIANAVFVLNEIKIIQCIAYGICGFTMSMIYAPITKIVAENTNLEYTTRILLVVTFAAFLASPLAGAAAIVLRWKALFVAGSILLFISGTSCFLFFSKFEKSGEIQYNQFAANAQNREEKKTNNKISILMENDIIRYTFVSLFTGVIRTSVIFWVPTFFVQYLSCSSAKAAGIYSVITLIISASPYIIVWCYRYVFGNNENRALLFCFVLGAVSFFLICVVSSVAANVILITGAIVCGNMASSVIWNIYCPKLKETGAVSTATGYLDFISYVGGAIANIIFANAVTQIGWKPLLVVWGSLMLAGAIIGVSWRKIR